MISNQIEQIISRNTLLWLLITNVAIISPLYDKLTLWTGGICAICFIWRIGIYFGRVSKPPRYLVTLLAVSAAGTLALVTSSIGALSALVNLLILGYALKYIECTNRRDVRAIVLVGYFLIALTFIYNQSIWNTIHLLVICGINTCVLVSLYQEKVTLKSTYKLAFTMVAQSLPLALVLFLVLPRLPPLWLVPDMKSAVTGLSDTLNFGDIGRLSRSDKLAFRATFDEDVPTNAELYWRALILDTYDGSTWDRNQIIKDIEKNAFVMQPDRGNPVGKTINYTVIAEPTHQNWLYGLDQAFSQTDDIYNLPDYRIYSLRAVDQKVQYRVKSAPNQAMDKSLHPRIKEINLSLPDDSNPKAKLFAQDMREKYPSPVDRLSAFMRYFRDNPFYYTLEPPRVGPQQIDDFLFTNKAGYCAHYASSLVFIARASGIPARMVTGYQGGEYNPKAGYVSVYQYMAHAWVEVWLKGQGWIRLDPTGMIAPERVNEGFDAIFEGEESYLRDSIFSGLQLKQFPLLNELRLTLSSIDYYWSVWVLGFDNDKQEQVLQDLLGKVDSSKLIALMLVSLSLVGIAISYSVGLFHFPSRQEPINRLYVRILNALAKKGIHKPQGIGPNDFVEQVYKLAPDLAPDFERFTQNYIALKYQNLPSTATQKCWHVYRKQASKLRTAIFRLRSVDSDKSNT